MRLGAIESGVLHGVSFLEAQVEPEDDAAQNGCTPGEPDVPRSGIVEQVARALTVFIGEDHLTEKNSNGEPSISAFTWFFFSLHGAPCLSINVSLSVGNGSEAEPEEEPRNREEMLWTDEQRVVDEEASKEVDQQQQLLIEDASKLFVASPNLPVPDRLSPSTAQPIILS